MTLSATTRCPASDWGMHPSRASANGTIECPLCLRSVVSGVMVIAGREVRLIGEHACR